MTKTFFVDALMLPKTLEYVEAMIREGDNFDYTAWLKRTRDKQAQTNQVSEAGVSPQAIPKQFGERPSTLDGLNWRVLVAPSVIAKLPPLRRPTIQASRKLRENSAKARLIRRLENVSQ